MQKWEYKKQYAVWKDQDDIFSALGEQGWEMVTAHVTEVENWGFYFWFKRPKQ
jgi:hypothetical protein